PFVYPVFVAVRKVELKNNFICHAKLFCVKFTKTVTLNLSPISTIVAFDGSIHIALAGCGSEGIYDML
ncbi:hypothetical protein, partial [Candidatus Hodarchaeum mangrovi]